MFAKATKWLCSVTHHQTGHVVKEKTVSFPFVSDFFDTWSSLHCFVNFFVSEAEASNEAKNTGRDNTKSKRGEQHVLPKANLTICSHFLNSNKRSIIELFSTLKIWLFSIKIFPGFLNYQLRSHAFCHQLVFLPNRFCFSPLGRSLGPCPCPKSMYKCPQQTAWQTLLTGLPFDP